MPRQYRAVFSRTLGSKLFASEWYDTEEAAMEFYKTFRDGYLFFRRIEDSEGNVV